MHNSFLEQEEGPNPNVHEEYKKFMNILKGNNPNGSEIGDGFGAGGGGTATFALCAEAPKLSIEYQEGVEQAPNPNMPLFAPNPNMQNMMFSKQSDQNPAAPDGTQNPLSTAAIIKANGSKLFEFCITVLY